MDVEGYDSVEIRSPSPTDTPTAQSYGHPSRPVLRTPQPPSPTDTSPTDTATAQSYGHPPVLQASFASFRIIDERIIDVPTPSLPPFVLLVGHAFLS